eukprot:symbB.v1.2.021994.t2/scaffold1933.1/size95709/3
MEVDSPPSTEAQGSRPSRKSEPPHVRHPERRTQESWEYPMSKEEKKDRVIFLFEQELSEARQNEEEQALDDPWHRQLMDDDEWDAELQAALAASCLDGSIPDDGDEMALLAALEASKLEIDGRFEDLELEQALEASLFTGTPSDPPFQEDPKAVEKALKASEQEMGLEQEKDAKKRDLIRKQEENSDLFQAALRASRVDLGPKGISQAAKILATGDATLGQASLAKSPAVPVLLLKRDLRLYEGLELYTHLERIEELRPGTAKRLKAAVRSIGLLEVDGASKWRNIGRGWLLAGVLVLLVMAAALVYWSRSGRAWLSWLVPLLAVP